MPAKQTSGCSSCAWQNFMFHHVELSEFIWVAGEQIPIALQGEIVWLRDHLGLGQLVSSQVHYISLIQNTPKKPVCVVRWETMEQASVPELAILGGKPHPMDIIFHSFPLILLWILHSHPLEVCIFTTTARDGWSPLFIYIVCPNWGDQSSHFQIVFHIVCLF